MFPILFEFGPFRVFSYGFMIALGLLLTFFIVEKRGVQIGWTPKQQIDFFILTMIAGFLGARFLYIVRFFEVFRNDLIRIFFIWEGGLILYGGTIFGVLFVFLYSKVKKKKFLELTDLIVPYFALSQGFGRIGCFLNGCCSGKPSDSVFSVTFPGYDFSVIPTQIYSAIFCVSLFLFLFFLSKKTTKVGVVTASYFLLYGVFRFIIEIFRINPKIIYGLTMAQVISIFLVIGGGSLLAKKWFLRDG